MVTIDFPAARLTDTAALREARRYAAVQPFIVNKAPLFEAMVRLVETAGPPPRRVVELGVGTGGFLEAIAAQGRWPEAECIGADLSAARIAVARCTMAEFGRSATLWAGVNALDADDDFYAQVARPGGADMVVLAQFEHYAPNDGSSMLARRLEQDGRPFCTKQAMRRLAASRLRPGGWLFVIDDYGADTAGEQASWNQAWDAHVVAEFARDEVRLVMDRIDPSWTAGLARRYDTARPLPQRLALAARARTRRRHRDGEEIQPLAGARADFQMIFGEGNCGMVPHPNDAAHPQFFLLWGRVATE